MLAIGIRVIAGGNYDDIMNTYGVSKGGFYHACNKFLYAVLTCDALDINLQQEIVHSKEKARNNPEKQR